MTDTVPIVLCADDFGLTPGVCEGILQLADSGRISAVSCMVSASKIRRFAAALRYFGDRIDIGLHLVLTDLAPEGEMPLLAPSGTLPTFNRLLRAALTGRLPAAEISAEVDRQLDSFEFLFDRQPDFIDGHHHVQQLPVIRDQLLRAVHDRYGRKGPFLRVSGDRPGQLLRRGTHVLRAAYVGFFAAGFRRRAETMGLRCTSGFSGIYDFSSDQPYAELFERFVTGVEPGTLIMCHPGQISKGEPADDPIAAQRKQELDFFLSDAFANLLVRRNLCLSRLTLD